MPRVLLVTYLWLPAYDAGVKQVATLARYLPETDWEPTILTREWDDAASGATGAPHPGRETGDDFAPVRAARAFPVVRSGYVPRDNRLLRWHTRMHSPGEPPRAAWSASGIARGMLDLLYPLYGDFPDAHRGWVEPAVAAGIATVRQYGISAVVSASPPASAHIVGGEIARRTGIPWVALFGDLGAFCTGGGDLRSLPQRMLQQRLGRRWLRGASRVAAGSPEAVAYLQARYGLEGETIVAPFDPEERRVAPRRVPGAPLRVVHVGQIRPGDQRPELMLDALDLMVKADPGVTARLRVELIGSRCDEVLAGLLAGRECAPVVSIRGEITAAETVKVQREADLLLVFNSTNDLAAGCPPAGYPPELFDHLNARRPTIAVGNDPGGAVQQLLAETRGGETGGDAMAIAALLRRYLEQLEDAGEIAFQGDEPAIAAYGGPEQARRLGVLLDAASGERFGSWQRR